MLRSEECDGQRFKIGAGLVAATDRLLSSVLQAALARRRTAHSSTVELARRPEMTVGRDGHGMGDDAELISTMRVSSSSSRAARRAAWNNVRQEWELELVRGLTV